MSMKEIRVDSQEIAARQKDTEKLLAEAWRATGENGSKWASCTEGLVRPAVVRVLRERFGADKTLRHVSAREDGGSQEFDTIGVTSGAQNNVIPTKIKSRLSESELKKFEQKFTECFQFPPESRGKTLLGMLATMETPCSMAKRVTSRGLCLMRSHAEAFSRFVPPSDFKPRTSKG